MRQELKQNVGGKDYIFYQFGASEGLKVWLRILKVIGTPIGALVGKVVNTGTKSDIKELGLDRAVELLCSNLDADDTLQLIKDILNQVTFEGKRVSEIFDVHFAGSYMQIFNVLYVALEVNYKDFLLGIAEKVGLQQAK